MKGKSEIQKGVPPGRIELRGGRYDGMLVAPLSGDPIPDDVRVLYFGRPDLVEWHEAAKRDPSFAVDAELKLCFAATSASPLPFRGERARDASLEAGCPGAWEPYVLGPDGEWRAPMRLRS